MIPNKSVEFFDRVLDLVVGICRFNSKFEYQSVDFVHHKGDFYALLKSMSDNRFRIDHDSFYNINNYNDTVNEPHC